MLPTRPIAGIVLAALIAVGATSCGGGGGGDSASNATPSTPSTPNTPSTPSTPSTPMDGDAPSTPATPATPTTPGVSNFSAALVSAPVDGATLTGPVSLTVSGTDMANVELLPSEGYTPRVAIFTVSSDKTTAILTFDTRTIPNGTLTVRIVAFDAPAGQPTNQITVMNTRTFSVNNLPMPRQVPIPPVSVMPRALISFYSLPYVDPQPLYELRDLSEAAMMERISTDWPSVEAVFRRYIPANVEIVGDDGGRPLTVERYPASCLTTPTITGACRNLAGYLITTMNSIQP